MNRAITRTIQLYQTYLSPDHSAWGKSRFPYGYCRFHPSCSEYTKQSIQKLGTLRGISRGFFRILKCNPFNPGGFDPVIKKNIGKSEESDLAQV